MHEWEMWHVQSHIVCACTRHRCRPLSCAQVPCALAVTQRVCVHQLDMHSLSLCASTRKSAGCHILHAGMCMACAGEHTMSADNSTCCTGNQMTSADMGTHVHANTRCVQTTYLSYQQAQCSWVEARSICRPTRAPCIDLLVMCR